MKEIALCFTDINNNLILDCHKILSTCLNRIGGLFTQLEVKKDIYYLIAFDEKFSPEVNACIFKIVCTIVREQYKKDYIQGSLKYKTKNNINYDTLIKALCCFDREGDERYIKRVLKYNSQLNIAAFCNFKITPLKERWQQLVAVSNKNNGYLTFSSTFYEILRFVISSLDFQTEKLVIKEEGSSYLIFDEKGEIDKINKNDLSALICQMIGNNPKRIIIQNTNKQVIEHLIMLFENRVEII